MCVCVCVCGVCVCGVCVDVGVCGSSNLHTTHSSLRPCSGGGLLSGTGGHLHSHPLSHIRPSTDPRPHSPHVSSG